MKKIITVVMALLVLLLLASQIFKTQLGERIFAKAVAKNLGNNTLIDLPDGLHVVLIGTGSPLADPSRAGPSTAIIAGKRVFVIDSGGGAVRRMGEIGLPPAAIERVLLTHFHSDHIDGLGELMLQRWAGGGHDQPLPIHGPDGIEDIIAGLNMTYAQDRDYRVAHHGADVVPPTGFGGKAIPLNLGLNPLATVVDEADLYIDAVSVNHHPVNSAVAYRFRYKGRSVMVTGDTKYVPVLAAYAKGSDILISEALNPDMVGVIETTAKNAGNNRIGKIMYDIPDYHITPVQAAEVAESAGVGMLVYTHIVPALPTPYLNAYFTKGAADKFSGDIIVGQDGMLFSLPAGSADVLRRDLK